MWNYYHYLDPGKQPSTVNVSGFNVNGTVKFPADSVNGTKLKIPEFFIEKQKFEIRNDTTALETLETYNLFFTGSSVVSAILGGPTQIQIKDDDGIYTFYIIIKSLMMYNFKI